MIDKFFSGDFVSQVQSPSRPSVNDIPIDAVALEISEREVGSLANQQS